MSGTGSPGCSSNRDQSIVRPSSRGGVPVFSRVQCRPSVRSCRAKLFEGCFAIASAAILLLRRHGPSRSETCRW